MNTLFGKNSKGEEVYIYTLKNEKGMQVSFLNLGAAVHEIYVPAKSGEQVQVSAIYDNPLSYEHQTTYFGAIVAMEQENQIFYSNEKDLLSIGIYRYGGCRKRALRSQ